MARVPATSLPPTCQPSRYFRFDLRPLEVTIVDPHTGHLLWRTWRIYGSIHPELAWDSIPLVVDFFKCIYQALYGFMRLSVDWSPRRNKKKRWNVWFHRIKFEMFRLWLQPGMTRKPVTERKVNSNLAHNRHSGDQVIWPLLSFFEPDVFAGNTTKSWTNKNLQALGVGVLPQDAPQRKSRIVSTECESGLCLPEKYPWNSTNLPFYLERRWKKKLCLQ